MESIWSKSAKIENHESLRGDMETEAVVIGGGLAGILTAFFLCERNIRTIVLEADRIGSGQTKNTTAKITSQHNLIYNKLIKQFGREKALQYAVANQNAIGEYRRIITDRGIDCSFEERCAYLFSRIPSCVDDIEEEAEAAAGLGIDAQAVSQTSLPFTVERAVRFSGQAQFNPMSFLSVISKGLDVFEKTKVIDVQGDKVITDYGTVTAKHIVFACHFPFINAPGFYFARMHQERSYVLALGEAQELNGMYLGIDKDALSFRNFGNLLLLGGGGHRTGENSGGAAYAYLQKRAQELYPESHEVLRWSAQDCMTLDGVPYIGRFSSSTPNWYVATGFGKWGMTSSMVSAALISDLITGKENPCAEVFSPSRFTPSASAKSFFEGMGQAAKGIGRQMFSVPQADIDALPLGHGGVVDADGDKAGVYKDEEGKVYIVSTRCPHLGCRLEWNPDEKSWDCPCHGSRFDYMGNLMDDPAQTDLERIDE
ncbi:MAG: FAD-dependent oxidoreductase [Clostridiaceae bacterium]|nr:FAD-dependent oxidoreductase [Clostridiaceae bacterium]